MLIIGAIAVVITVSVLSFKHAAARFLLGLVGAALAVGAVSGFRSASELRAQLERRDRYPIDASAGTHTIRIAPLEQIGAYGYVEGFPADAPLEALKWEPSPPGELTDEAEERIEPPGAVPLVRVERHSEATGWELTYTVPPELDGRFEGAVLVVRHDSRARHLIRDHALLFDEWLATACVIGAIVCFAVVAAGACRKTPSDLAQRIDQPI